jgi:hypothetical protein
MEIVPLSMSRCQDYLILTALRHRLYLGSRMGRVASSRAEAERYCGSLIAAMLIGDACLSA